MLRSKRTTIQRRPTYKVSFLGGRVPLDLRFRGPLEAKSFVRATKLGRPGAQGRVLDLDCASCGHVRRNKASREVISETNKKTLAGSGH
jgi:hypothetical protein